MIFIKRLSFIFFALLILSSCKHKKDQLQPSTSSLTEYYAEPYRSQFHFTPEKMWMNDPNGMVYHKGIYHLFYQYYPENIIWGPMHWGHATSKDLVHWNHKPIALYPDEHGYIFSGSAVVDEANTSGFGSLDNPPLVAIFTYHFMEGEKAGRKDFQTQGIAYSLDNGNTWTKFEGNPVIGNEGIKDFRDPKVIWHEETKRWVMSLVAGDHVKFYTSENLKEWKLASEFGNNKGAHGGVWECPDLFPIKVEGSDEVRWVLIISVNPGGPNGGSGTQYFVGDFDGETFTTNQKEIKWIDFGTDNYAGVTYSNAPENEPIFIGWMSNWSYALRTPTEAWRSAMTLPRKLTLRKKGGDYNLFNYPVSQLESILEVSRKLEDFEVKSGAIKVFDGENFSQSEVRFKTNFQNMFFGFKNGLEEIVSLGFNKQDASFYLDRGASGKVNFQENFGKGIQKMPMAYLPKEEVEVRIIVDASSLEIFINEGQYVMTVQLFPNENYQKFYFENTSANVIEVSDFEIRKVNRIW